MSAREELFDDPEEAALVAQDGHQARIWTALPGVVDAVDLDAQTVSVQPTVKATIMELDEETGELVEKSAALPLLIHVPLVFPRAGGFALTFPVAKGDEVLVVFASRAIDSWWQSGGVQAPHERRMHDLSDGFAIPGPTSQVRKLGGVSGSSVQLRNEDGSSFCEITDTGDMNIRATGNVNAKADGDLTLEAANISLEASGNVTLKAGGEVVVQAPRVDVQAPAINLNGIGWATHVHGGGSTPSGPPA